jgi:hypothetical protein
MKLKVILVLVSASFCLITSCNREHEPTPDYLRHIFPIEEGKTRTYQVTDTVYQSTNQYDAGNYYLKEETGGIETDLLGREVNVLDLSTSQSYPEANWNHLMRWRTISDDGYAERIEGNTRILAMQLPPYQGFSWNGNRFNQLASETYRYLNIDTSIVVLGKTYEHCVYVEQIPYSEVGVKGEAFFQIKHAYEIYAPSIGKIEGYSKFYEQQGTAIDKNSKVYHEKLIAFDE